MIWPSPLLADVERRDRRRALRKRTLRIVVAVVAGIFVSGWVHSPAPTPSNIARGYVAAGFARDWDQSWGLLCQRAKLSQGDVAQYAARSNAEFARRFMPKDVEVAVTDMRGVAPGPSGPSIAVTVSVTSRERRALWGVEGRFILVKEDGAFRICGGAMGSG
jgi:hypothetical protein